MSLRLLAITLGLAASALAQPDPAAFASGLRARFGPPLARETFVARPGLQMVVDYASDGHVCRIELPSIAPGRDNPQVQGPQAVDDFIEELLPAAIRGKENRRMLASFGLTSISIVEYENLTVAETSTGATRTAITVTFPAERCADKPAQ
jgi:hypothetical protein